MMYSLKGSRHFGVSYNQRRRQEQKIHTGAYIILIQDNVLTQSTQTQQCIKGEESIPT